MGAISRKLAMRFYHLEKSLLQPPNHFKTIFETNLFSFFNSLFENKELSFFLNFEADQASIALPPCGYDPYSHFATTEDRKSSNIDPHSSYLFLCLLFADQKATVGT